MPIIINPGTEGRPGATLENAEKIVAQICVDLGIERSSLQRRPEGDSPRGLYAYVHEKFEIDVPGDPPEQFLASVPFESRRMYVDGSSWLYKYGLNQMRAALEGGEDA